MRIFALNSRNILCMRAIGRRLCVFGKNAVDLDLLEIFSLCIGTESGEKSVLTDKRIIPLKCNIKDIIACHKGYWESVRIFINIENILTIAVCKHHFIIMLIFCNCYFIIFVKVCCTLFHNIFYSEKSVCKIG